MVLALNEVVHRSGHVVAEVVETEFVVGTEGDVACVCLLDLSEFWWKGMTEGFAGSCGLLDERIRLYAIERDVMPEQLKAMDGKNQTYVEENEWIRTVVLPYEEAAHKFIDGKNLIALFLYERWLEARK